MSRQRNKIDLVSHETLITEGFRLRTAPGSITSTLWEWKIVEIVILWNSRVDECKVKEVWMGNWIAVNILSSSKKKRGVQGCWHNDYSFEKRTARDRCKDKISWGQNIETNDIDEKYCLVISKRKIWAFLEISWVWIRTRKIFPSMTKF